MEVSGGSSDYSRETTFSQSSQDQNSDISEVSMNGKRDRSQYYDNYLWFGPKGSDGRHPQFCTEFILSHLCLEYFVPTNVLGMKYFGLVPLFLLHLYLLLF